MSLIDPNAPDITYGGIGPQDDGTLLLSDIALMPQPNDTAGGIPATYPQGILDIFKYGVGVWQQQANQSAILDYKRFEATNGGLYQQGRGAAVPRASSGGGMSSLAMLGIGAVIVFALLQHKG